MAGTCPDGKSRLYIRDFKSERKKTTFDPPVRVQQRGASKIILTNICKKFTLWYNRARRLCCNVNVQICVRTRTITVERFRAGCRRDQVQHLQHHGAPGVLRVFRKQFNRAP